MAEDDSDDKTEAATPDRRRKAREEDGRFPRARDTGSVAATVAVLLVLSGTWGDLLKSLRGFCLQCFTEPLSLFRGGFALIVEQTAMVLLVLCLPIALAAMVGGIGAGIAEGGFHPNLNFISPKWERLAPLGKLQQMFSPKSGAISTFLSLGRVLVVAWVAYSIAKSDFPRLLRLSRAPVDFAAGELASVVLRLAFWATLSLALLTALDYVQSWFQFERSIRMSKQEIKEEHHQQEGSPQIRARQRQRARELAKRGIRKQVREADVVITNPTHVAVAIRYRSKEGAPVVAAKGYDEIAQHIKQIAREYNVPMVENRPLARALAERVRVGRVIPVDLFTAVAEVLAFVYRLKGRGWRA